MKTNMRANKLLCVLLCCVMLWGIIPITALAEGTDIVTLNLANGNIEITPTGYKQDGRPEIQFTGKYIITGDKRANTPLRFLNDTGSPANFDVVLKDAQIIAPNWCTAVCLDGDSDITLNLTNEGSSKISSHNHGVFKANVTGTVTINITNPDGAGLTLERRDKYKPKIYQNVSGSMSVNINGSEIDNSYNYPAPTVITEVHAAVTEPVFGENPDFDPTVAAVPENADTHIYYTFWAKIPSDGYSEKPDIDDTGWQPMYEDDTFEEGYYYALVIVVETDLAAFDSNITATINNVSCGAEASSDGMTAILFYTFDPIDHSAVKVDGTAATCTEDGWKDYYKCDWCGLLFEDEACTVEISDFDTWKTDKGRTDKLDHDLGEYTVDPENTDLHYRKCSRCDYFIRAEHTPGTAATETAPQTCTACGYVLVPALGHSAVKIEGKAAAAAVDGWKDYYKCTRCGLLFEDEACTVEITDLDAWKTGAGKLPATGTTEPDKPTNPGTTEPTKPADTTKPQTGDSSSIIFWLILMLASCGGIVGIVIVYKKKRTGK